VWAAFRSLSFVCASVSVSVSVASSNCPLPAYLAAYHITFCLLSPTSQPASRSDKTDEISHLPDSDSQAQESTLHCLPPTLLFLYSLLSRIHCPLWSVHSPLSTIGGDGRASWRDMEHWSIAPSCPLLGQVIYELPTWSFLSESRLEDGLLA